MRAVTLKDIAIRAGVHPSTVSKILREKENIQISDVTRKKVQKIAQDLDYHPNQMAQAFRLKKTFTIALIIPEISNSFFSGIARAIEEESYRAGYNLVVCNTNENSEKEEKYIKNFISRGIDGFIIAPAQKSESNIENLMKRKIPFVLVDRSFSSLQTNAVVSDNKISAYKSVKYLYELGHKRIGFIRGVNELPTIQLRLNGYLKAIGEFNLDKNPDLICGNGFTVESGIESTKKVLALENPPTALIVSGNMLTIGTIKAIMEKELSIPEDISIIGYADDTWASCAITPLTVISHQLDYIGKKSINLLLEQINSNDKDFPVSKVEIETKLIIRKSTGPVKRIEE